MDFNQLKDLPAWVILAGIAVYLITENKKDRDYYRNETREDKKNFLDAINNLSTKQDKTDSKVDNLTNEFKVLSNEVRRNK